MDWETCTGEVRQYLAGFVDLLRLRLEQNLKGVYLHGSLAMGCFHPEKSDLDLIAVVFRPFPPAEAEELNCAIARYADSCPAAGGLEFSVITAGMAEEVPASIVYLLHYSPMWRERILRGCVDYSGQQTDIDLSAHLAVIRQRGICLYGTQIDETFGSVKQRDFAAAVAEDLTAILSGDNLLDNPCYGVLNICRALQALQSENLQCLSKEEGALWALDHLPARFHPLIRQALAIYRSEGKEADSQTPVCSEKELAVLRRYARKALEQSRGRWE